MPPYHIARPYEQNMLNCMPPMASPPRKFADLAVGTVVFSLAMKSFTSLSSALKDWTVRMPEKVASAWPPAAAYTSSAFAFPLVRLDSSMAIIPAMTGTVASITRVMSQE